MKLHFEEATQRAHDRKRSSHKRCRQDPGIQDPHFQAVVGTCMFKLLLEILLWIRCCSMLVPSCWGSRRRWRVACDEMVTSSMHSKHTKTCIRVVMQKGRSLKGLAARLAATPFALIRQTNRASPGLPCCGTEAAMHAARILQSCGR